MWDSQQYRAREAALESLLNVGADDEPSIVELARLVARMVGYRGDIVFDPSRPDGTPLRRCATPVRCPIWRSRTVHVGAVGHIHARRIAVRCLTSRRVFYPTSAATGVESFSGLSRLLLRGWLELLLVYVVTDWVTYLAARVLGRARS